MAVESPPGCYYCGTPIQSCDILIANPQATFAICDKCISGLGNEIFKMRLHIHGLREPIIRN